MAARMVFKNGSEEGFKSEVGGGYISHCMGRKGGVKILLFNYKTWSSGSSRFSVAMLALQVNL